MAYRDMTAERWAKLLSATPDGNLTVNGSSPGPVATSLGISRQALHKAIRANRLDAIRIVDGRGKTQAVLIPGAEIQRFKKARAQKNG